MDTLRLAVGPTEVEPDGFQVQIWINDLDVTAAGAGLGMDPYDLLVPHNRFLPGDEPTTIPVARCGGCGVYGCGSTDVTITRTADVVRWDWHLEKPMRRAVSFNAQAYEKAVTSVASDHSWETPARRVGRLVLGGIGNDELPDGLHWGWVANNWRNPQALQICLHHRDQHQVFVNLDWATHTPEQLAAEIRRMLVETPPETWNASWSSIQRTDTPPPMAGETWTQDREHSETERDSQDMGTPSRGGVGW